MINKDTWELEFSKLPDMPETNEDDLVQENADISDNVSVNKDSDEIADQTDIQVMILTGNMAAFAS